MLAGCTQRTPRTPERTVILDRWMPVADAAERHRLVIAAPLRDVFLALEHADLGGPLARAVLVLRAAPNALVSGRAGLRELTRRAHAPLTLAALTGAGFGRVVTAPPHALVLGLEGPFWRLAPAIRPVDADGAAQPVLAGVARALWSFELRAIAPALTEIVTETRVTCGDAASRRRFRRYWWLIRPGSGLLRRLMLRAVRRAAEGGAQ